MACEALCVGGGGAFSLYTLFIFDVYKCFIEIRTEYTMRKKAETIQKHKQKFLDLLETLGQFFFFV